MTLTTKLTALAVVQIAAATALAFSARAEDADDSKFLQEAIETDMAEVKMSELALQRSSDDGVRDLAHRLQSDHSVSMQEAAALAKDLGTRIPSALDPEAQQHYASLAKLSGQEFDAAFVSFTVAGHRHAVAKFDDATRTNPNSAIASFAAKTLPTLKQHLATAETLLSAGVHPSAQAHGAPAESRDAPPRDPQLRVPPQEPSTPPPL
jgi:putative membrane protein